MSTRLTNIRLVHVCHVHYIPKNLVSLKTQRDVIIERCQVFWFRDLPSFLLIIAIRVWSWALNHLYSAFPYANHFSSFTSFRHNNNFVCMKIVSPLTTIISHRFLFTFLNGSQPQLSLSLEYCNRYRYILFVQSALMLFESKVGCIICWTSFVYKLFG